MLFRSEHLYDHYSLYDEFIGVRSARKHIGWYLRALPGGEVFRAHMNTLGDSAAQVAAVEQFLDALNDTMDRIPAHAEDMSAAGHDLMELAL